METKQYTTIDKGGWIEGPWNKEPDKVQWQDEATGMPCLAVRHPTLGNWCGYVGVTTDHPLFGKHYDTPDVSVHGGLTFSDVCRPHDTEDTGICHVPGEGEPDHVWWFGFDCAHFNDFSPGLEATTRKVMPEGHVSSMAGNPYRTLKYVQKECANLANQLKEAEHAQPIA